MLVLSDQLNRWYALALNPEPWAVGDISRGKTGARLSPNPNLVAFQNAIREGMADEEKLPDDFRMLEFFFWRQQARYIDAADRVRQRNQADATNCQKGLEDALQGILFDNDREIIDIRSVMCGQGPKIEPLIVIHARKTGRLHGYDDLPAEILEFAVNGLPEPEKKKDAWADANDELF